MLTRYTCLGQATYRDPYDWGWMLNFLRRRAVDHIETVTTDAFCRSLALGPHQGLIRIVPQPGRVAVFASGSLPQVGDAVLACVVRLFDLDADPLAISDKLTTLPDARPGIRLPGSPSAFEFAVRAIMEQQISTAAAVRLTGKLVARFGRPIASPEPQIDRLFPDAHDIAAQSKEALAEIGLPASRAHALHTIASRLVEGSLSLDAPQDVDAGMAALIALPGIGPWTAAYIALRGWSARDVFLPTDHAIAQKFPGLRARDILALAEAWRPYRSYAVLQMWENGANHTVRE